MGEVVGRIEGVERTVAHFKVVQILLPDRIVAMGENEDDRSRLGAQAVIDDPAVQERLLQDKVGGVVRMSAGGPGNPATAAPESSPGRTPRTLTPPPWLPR